MKSWLRTEDVLSVLLGILVFGLSLATLLGANLLAWSPNKLTPGAGFPDVDILGIRERFGGPTFTAVTSRSYHPGGVNIALCDGSVRFVPNSTSGTTWRALGTIAISEVIGEF